MPDDADDVGSVEEDRDQVDRDDDDADDETLDFDGVRAKLEAFSVNQQLRGSVPPPVDEQGCRRSRPPVLGLSRLTGTLRSATRSSHLNISCR